MLLSSMMVMAQQPGSGLTDILIGDGDIRSCEIPFNACTGGWAYTESIYPVEVIGGPCLIYSVSFACPESAMQYGGPFPYDTYKLTLFMGTTTRSNYASTADWTPSADLQIYCDYPYGTMIGPDSNGWITFELNQPYSFEGGNLVLGVAVCGYLAIGDKGYDKDGNDYSPMKIACSESPNGTLSVKGGWWYESFTYPPDAETQGVLSDLRPNIKLTAVMGMSLTSIPETIDMGFRPNGCWTEGFNALLKNVGMSGTVISMATDNNFFVPGDSKFL